MKERKRVRKGQENGKARVDTPVSGLEEKDTIMHYNAVLMEEIRSQMALILEAMAAMRSEFDEKLHAFRQDVDEKFDALRLYMDRRFAMVDERFDRVDERFDRLEQRVSLLETVTRGLKDDIVSMAGGVERIGACLDGHEQRISSLEAVH